jgi:hypothetical protein
MESSRRRHACVVPVVLIGLLPGCSSPSAQPAQSSRQPPGAAVNPITVDSTEEQIRQAVGTARVGKKLTPKTWPNGAGRTLQDFERMFAPHDLTIEALHGDYRLSSYDSLTSPRMILVARKNAAGSESRSDVNRVQLVEQVLVE